MKAALLVLLLAGCAAAAHATSLVEAQAGDVRIILTDEPCALPAITNLPLRATWTENGKVSQGCFAVRPEAGVVVLYFDDKTAVAIPIDLFKRVTSA